VDIASPRSRRSRAYRSATGRRPTRRSRAAVDAARRRGEDLTSAANRTTVGMRSGGQPTATASGIRLGNRRASASLTNGRKEVRLCSR